MQSCLGWKELSTFDLMSFLIHSFAQTAGVSHTIVGLQSEMPFHPSIIGQRPIASAVSATSVNMGMRVHMRVTAIATICQDAEARATKG